MNLAISIQNANTCAQLRQIFENDVQVIVDTIYGTDYVSVKGYSGIVSTDFIANQIFHKFIKNDKLDDIEGKELANLLEQKVFCPLRDRIVKLDHTNCCSTLIYKIRNFARIGWTPENFNLTAGYSCLKHSMPLMCLKKEV